MTALTAVTAEPVMVGDPDAAIITRLFERAYKAEYSLLHITSGTKWFVVTEEEYVLLARRNLIQFLYTTSVGPMPVPTFRGMQLEREDQRKRREETP
jgi:hypothetical protein